MESVIRKVSEKQLHCEKLQEVCRRDQFQHIILQKYYCEFYKSITVEIELNQRFARGRKPCRFSSSRAHFYMFCFLSYTFSYEEKSILDMFHEGYSCNSDNKAADSAFCRVYILCTVKPVLRDHTIKGLSVF